MLRVLGSTDLEGYVFQTPGGPPCELLTGVVSKIQVVDDAVVVSLRGYNLENGHKVMRVASIMFQNRGSNRKMLKTRVIAAGVTNGVYLSVLVMQRNNKRIAMDFKFSGLWRFKGYKGEINVLFGKYEDLRLQENLVAFRFLDYNTYQKCYYRRTVDISETKMLARAKRDFLASNARRACICICGAEQKNGSMSSYHCIWYEMIEESVGCRIS